MTLSSDIYGRIRQIKRFHDRSELVFAIEQAEALIVDHPDRPEAWGALGNVYKEVSDVFRAARAYDRAAALGDKDLGVMLNAATSWMLAGETDQGIDRVDRYERVCGRTNRSLLVRSEILERNNRLEDALEFVTQVHDDSEQFGYKQVTLAKIAIGRKDFGEAIEHLKPLKEDESVTLEARRTGWFLQAKIHDREGDYDDAWAAATTAQTLDGDPPGHSGVARIMNRLREQVSRETLDVCSTASQRCEQPLFIMGMARSGTSLVEQILSMHPEVGCAGESAAGNVLIQRVARDVDSFNEYPKNLIDIRVSDADQMQAMYLDATSWCAPEASRITNKAISLAMEVPLLDRIMPGARVVLLRRHPLDNAVSCYTTPLRVGTRHIWAGSLESIAETQLAFHALADHYAEHLTLDTFSLWYEELVADQEGRTRALIDFAGLEWNEACMEFYKSRRVAMTISYDQVNQKIYRSSHGRWKNYERHLGPLIDRVGSILPD